ncbi:MAG: hypothetical protein M0P31_00240 [Solirubrobacteraceae bacterium]|nr:hypothetical protein [Solirubrobacteraceae bacterium]
MAVIDDALKTWKQRLAQLEKELAPLQAEAEELRDAIGKVEGTRPASTKPAATRGRAAAKPKAPAKRTARPKAKRTPTGRSPRGQNRTLILAAIATDAKTAGEVAEETGIGRGTVASTLHKLARDGAAVKAERGYRAADPAADKA